MPSQINAIGRTNFDFNEALLFEHGSEGRLGVDLPANEPSSRIDQRMVAECLGMEMRRADEALVLPQLSEPEVGRHYTRMSRWNFSIDTGPYPLGSCTMKHNPRINEWAARLPGFALIHPYLPQKYLQGALELMWWLQNDLAEIGGFDAISLQPAAGAHGEFVGVAAIVKALKARGEKRHRILVPESAHGTNPATASFFGLEIVTLPTNAQGRVSAKDVLDKMSGDVAGLMITNPNTIGIFESEIVDICDIVHQKGGYVYGDGANLNALMGIARPGDLGIDVMHYNLHKTFTTPHGGGGPGCGAVGTSKSLSPFLPTPLVKKNSDGTFAFDEDRPHSIGRVRSFYGNFGMMVRAFTYIREMGPQGLKAASERAVLNANYVRARLKDHFHLPFESDCLHEVVITDKRQKLEHGVTTLDMAKRLLDYGIHPPTIYFPLVVQGAMMIEPTETETKEDLDRICDALIAIANEAKTDPEKVKGAPHHTAISRLDEALAARKPILRWQSE
jgi:glycine dehydrogenase subunit 2